MVATQTAPALPVASPEARALAAIGAELRGRIFGQDEAIECLLLAVASKLHGFLVGAPGEGKSYLVTSLAAHFAGARVFATVAHPTAGEDDVVGPYDLAALNASPSRVARETAGYLPEAHLAFIDEVMRAGGHLRDLLLPIMNERRLRIGAATLHLPLHSMFLASNTWPTEEADAAFFDRCSLRTLVKQPTKVDVLGAMFATAAAPVTVLDVADLSAIARQAAAVRLPANLRESVGSFFGDLEGAGLRASTRRWCWCLPVLRAAAYLDGRDVVRDEDFSALRFVLAATPDEVAIVAAAARARLPEWVRVALRDADTAVDAHAQWASRKAAQAARPVPHPGAEQARKEHTAESTAIEAAAVTLNMQLRETAQRLRAIDEAARAEGRTNVKVAAAARRVRELSGAMARHFNV